MKVINIKCDIKLMFFFTSLFSIAAFSQQTRKVLFLGNSYTSVNNLPNMVSELALSTGDILIYDSSLVGGYTLEDHYASLISKNKILSNDWDYVVLQEQSQRPAFEVPSGFINGFSDLNSYINQNKPCAIVSSFMTWGHENGDTQNCLTNPIVCSYSGMFNSIKNRYMDFSNLFESEVTPVGEVWDFIKENYPNINLYQTDGSHPSLAGSYLAACCFYTSIFRKNPILISNDFGLDATTASIIRNAAKTIVYDNMLDWYIGKYTPYSNFNYKIGNGINEIIITENTSLYQDSFTWDFGDGTTSTALFPTHSYTLDGTYTIRLTSNNCYLGQNHVSIFERTVNFCSHTNTIFPDLLLCPDTSETVWTQPADSYQWLDGDGNPIIGATNQSLEVLAGFSYSVLTTINECIEMSPQIFVDVYIDGIGENPCNLGIIDIDKNPLVKIYPNPSTDEIFINSHNPLKSIQFINYLGQINKVIFKYTSDSKINISDLADGIYLIEMIDDNSQTITKKIIKKR